MVRFPALIALAVSFTVAAAQDTAYTPRNQQIPAPDCLSLHPAPGATACPADTHERWLADIAHWRDERRIRIAFDPSRYKLPALAWTQSSFIQTQMMVTDRYFYDSSAGRYTVDRYLDDLRQRYGGVDAVLLWAPYPNLGIDDRNQIEITESIPGGIDGLRKVVAEFHRRGVRVLLPMMMWDQATHPPGKTWPQAIAEFMKEIGADGVNGDTQDGVPLGFSLAAEAIGHPLAFEPEQSPSDEDLSWNLLNWGQYSFPFLPMVDRYKWIEPRHMVNISDRWARDKTDDLQYAFFNGIGWESWENIWGVWNGIDPRDAEATRRIATIERAVASFLVSPGWEPLYPMRSYGVFSSRWPLNGSTVWTIVNRTAATIAGPQMDLPATPGMRYFDLYHGVELKPLPADAGSNALTLSFEIEPNGYGAILATPGQPSPAIRSLLGRMAKMTAQPLASFSHDAPVLLQQMVPIPPTKPATHAPEGMIRIPGGSFDFKVEGVEVEGGPRPGVDVQYPWEDSPRRAHQHVLQVAPFYIDKYPVTNAEFKNFLDATHYAPRDRTNFLRDWKTGAYPKGWENRPVTWVSLEDARAYAAWAGKRLPHEWEWQLAAQGTEGRVYPWGNQWQPANMPAPVTSHTMTAPAPVDAHPHGASPYGVMDMTGNVWQWTDEFADEHTRAAIVRGGEYYQPKGSIWYFPSAFRNTEHGKVLLMSPSYDRSGGVGFRCVVDAQ